VLRALLRGVPEALLAVFVDEEGECVDYCSSLPPYDAKIAGAQVHVMMHDIAQTFAKFRGGKVWFVHVQGSEREMIARRVSDEYLLVVITRPLRVEGPLRAAIDASVAALRAEGEIARPRWEPHRQALVVEVREARGWGYAPEVIYDRGVRTEILAVLGRFGEARAASVATCSSFEPSTAKSSRSRIASTAACGSDGEMHLHAHSVISFASFFAIAARVE
jgi:hypothetical protein